MYLEYENYLLNIRNALIQCGIEFEEGISQDTSDYLNLYKLGIKLADILMFYKVLAVSGSENMLDGFFLPLNETYKDRMRGICYNEFVTSVLPDYQSLVGADGDFMNFPDDLADDVYEEEYFEEDGSEDDSTNYTPKGIDLGIDISEDTISTVEYVRNGIYLDEGISSNVESYGGYFDGESEDYNDDESSYESYEGDYEEDFYDDIVEESSYDDDFADLFDDETPYEEFDDEEESVYGSYEEEESPYDEFDEEESDYGSYEDDDFEEMSYDEDLEESPYYDEDEESSYDDNSYDDVFDESPYDEFDDEESPYDSVFDDEEESDYGADYEESSYEDYDESEEGSQQGTSNKINQPVKLEPIKRFSKESDMGEDIQDITNAFLTKVKRGAINFLNRKE